MWIEQKKVTRPKCNSCPNSWEFKITYDFIIDDIMVVVNMCLNNRHSKVRINMTSQVNINSKTESIVITCMFFVWWRWLLVDCCFINVVVGIIPPYLLQIFLASGSPPTFSGWLLFSGYHSPLSMMAMAASTHHFANSNPFALRARQRTK